MIAATFARALPWLLLAAMAAAGLQTYRLAREQAAHAGTVAQHARQIAAFERTGREAEAAARAEDARRFTELQEIANATRTELDSARADAAGAVDAGVRLRQRLAAIAAGCHPAADDTAATSRRETARPADDLLADVQRRFDQAADGIARHADAARIAGSACEQAYNALNGPPAVLH